MLTIWKTVVQPKLDYCSVLWSPNDQGSISRLESISRRSLLFNLIPVELRGMSGTVDQFKYGLDKWLSSMPDQPTIGSRQRAAKTT